MKLKQIQLAIAVFLLIEHGYSSSIENKVNDCVYFDCKLGKDDSLFISWSMMGAPIYINRYDKNRIIVSLPISDSSLIRIDNILPKYDSIYSEQFGYYSIWRDYTQHVFLRCNDKSIKIIIDNIKSNLLDSSAFIDEYSFLVSNSNDTREIEMKTICINKSVFKELIRSLTMNRYIDLVKYYDKEIDEIQCPNKR